MRAEAPLSTHTGERLHFMPHGKEKKYIKQTEVNKKKKTLTI